MPLSGGLDTLLLPLDDLFALECEYDGRDKGSPLHEDQRAANVTLEVTLNGEALLQPTDRRALSEGLAAPSESPIACADARREQACASGNCNETHRLQVRCTGSLGAFLDHSHHTYLRFVASCPMTHEVPLRLAIATDLITPRLVHATALIESRRDDTLDRREFRGRVHEWLPRQWDAEGERGCDELGPRPPCQAYEDLTPLHFTRLGPEANLGGKGPTGGPEALRVPAVATLPDGTAIDMLVTSHSTYTPHNPWANAVLGQTYLQLNVRAGTDVELELSFVRHMTPAAPPIALDALVTLGLFRLDVLDFDSSHGGFAAETVSIMTPLEDAYATADAEIATKYDERTNQTTFVATSVGDGHDNPADPHVLTPLQRARGLALTFRNQSAVRLRLGTTSPAPGDTQGRNLLFYGAASAVRPTCLQVEACLSLQYRSPIGKTCLERRCSTMRDGGQYVIHTAMSPWGRAVEHASLQLSSHAPNRDLHPVELALPIAVSAEARQWWRPALGSFAHALDTAWLIPTSQPRAAPSGRLIFVPGTASIAAGLRDPSAWLIARAGRVAVSVYHGMYATTRTRAEPPADAASALVATVPVASDGSFQLPSGTLPPSMYTLRVTTDHLALAFDTHHLLWSSRGVDLTFLVVGIDGLPDDQSEANDGGDDAWLTLLSWEAGAALELIVAFGSSAEHCEVSSARTDCNGVRWQQSSARSQVLSFPQLASTAGHRYALYVSRSERRCEGFGLSAVAGSRIGSATTINCWGDPASGEGYCYSSPDGGQCVRCRLWPSDHPTESDRVCTDFGRPQGGHLKGAKEWDLLGGNTDAWNAHMVSRRIDSQRSCSGGIGRSRARLTLVRGKKLVHSFELMSVDGGPMAATGGTVGAGLQRVSCANGEGFMHGGRRGSMRVDEAQFVRERSDPSAACQDVM